MFQKWRLSITLCMISLLSPVMSSADVGFEAAEHLTAGETVKLYFDAQDSGQTLYKLHLANGLELTFAQMMTLSGDFYAVPGGVISDGQTFDERKSRFIAAYNTLATDPAAVSEVPKIFAV